MTPVIAFAAVIAVFAAAFALALGRGALALRETRTAPRAAAAANGWRLEEGGDGGFGFHLSGRSADGIEWTLRGDDAGASAGEPMTPSIVWSTAGVSAASAHVLLVQGRRAVERLRTGAGLATTRRLVAAHGWDGALAGSLHRDGHEFALRGAAVAERFVALTTDDGVAAAALGADVERALLRWRPEQVSIWVGRDLHVRFDSGRLGRDDVAALVELGTAVARGCRSRHGRALA